MKRLILAVLLATLCAGLAHAETLAERYWRLHRERNPTTRYGAPPTAGTNQVDQVSGSARYLRMTITAKRSSTENLLQLSEIKLVTTNGTAFAWPSGTSVSAKVSTGNVSTSSSETPAKLIDNSVSTKMCAQNGKNLPCTITIDLGSGKSIDLSVYSRWQWYTANDVANRDPTSFSFSASNDGVKWVELNAATNATVTTSRRALAYTGNLDLAAYAAGFFGYATVLPTVSRETVREMLAPAPTGEPPELADGDLLLDCLAIPEGNWLCECPVDGTGSTVWRAALCPSNILAAVVWRHAVGLAPTNLPVTIAHDPTRAIGRIERLFYEQGTGVVARLRVRSAGYAEALSNRCDNLSPDLRCFTTVTNVAVRTDGWIHEHQDYIEARCVPRGEDMSSVTNVPAGVQAVVMAPIFLKGVSFVQVPLLPTYVEQIVPSAITNAYPARPPRPWHW